MNKFKEFLKDIQHDGGGDLLSTCIFVYLALALVLLRYFGFIS